MPNHLNNFQSFIEVSIALNLAFIALEQISNKIKNLFAEELQNKIESSKEDISSFQDSSTIKIQDIGACDAFIGDAAEKEKEASRIKKVMEHTADLISSIENTGKEFNTKKDEYFKKMFESTKSMYIASGIYGILLLFLSGHISCGVAGSQIGISIFIILSMLLMGNIYFTDNDKSVYLVSLWLLIIFLLSTIAPFVLSHLEDTKTISDSINTIASDFTKYIVYGGLLLLYTPIVISLLKFYKAKKLLKQQFEEKVSKYMEKKNELEKTIDELLNYSEYQLEMIESKKELSSRLDSF